MTTYSPEFSAYWHSEIAPDPSRDSGDASAKETLSTAQEIALEELAERVFAARSVV
jgi:hypothetical protein